MKAAIKQKEEGCQMIRFGDIAQESKGSSKDPIADGYERYIGLEHMDSQSLRILRWGSIAEDNPTFSKTFKAGQILFGRRRAYLKKAAVPDFDGICSGDIIVIEPKGNLILPELLPFIIQSDVFFEWAIKHSAGGLSPRTKFKSLAEFKFPLPKQKRQQEILRVMEGGIDPPPIKESTLNGDSAIHKGLFYWSAQDGEEELFDRADHWFIAAGGGHAVAGQGVGCDHS